MRHFPCIDSVNIEGHQVWIQCHPVARVQRSPGRSKVKGNEDAEDFHRVVAFLSEESGMNGSVHLRRPRGFGPQLGHSGYASALYFGSYFSFQILREVVSIVSVATAMTKTDREHQFLSQPLEI